MNRRIGLGERLARRPVLWCSLVLTLALSAAFQAVVLNWGLTLLDTLVDPGRVRAAIAAMSPVQRCVHAWTTASLDVVYPLAYGALFIGCAHRFYPVRGRLLALPVYVLVPADLAEGVVQVLALTGTADWMPAKLVLTPLKGALVLFALLTTVTGVCLWLLARWRERGPGGSPGGGRNIG